MIRVDDNEQCPCYSNKLYISCCKPYIEKTEEDYRNAIDNYKYIEAYRISLALFTGYLINVKSHTIRLLAEDEAFGNWILQIDIKALKEYLDRIIWLARLKNISDNLDDRFMELSNLIEDNKWRNLFHFYALVYSNIFNKSKMHTILDKINLDSSCSKDLLQMAYSIISYEQGIGKIIQIANLIIDKTDDIFEIIQYKFSIAIHYFMANDTDSCLNITKEVLNKLENQKEVLLKQNLFVKHMMGSIYEGCFWIYENEQYAQEALNLYKHCIKAENLTETGYSMIYSNIGYLYLKLKLFDLAISYLKKSIEYNVNNFSLIFLAETFLYTENYSEANNILNMIDEHSLEEQAIDFYIVKSEYILIVGDKNEIKNIINKMKLLNINKSPYFNDIINKLIIELQEANNHGLNNFLTSIKRIRKYLILQPQIGGIGIDINKILDDMQIK